MSKSDKSSFEAVQYRIPGRINLIGEHTDYNLGFVMPAAVDLGLDFEVSPSDDDQFHFYSHHFEEWDSCSPVGQGASRKWSKFFTQTLAVLHSKGYKLSPIKLKFNGNLPIGAGMSSSSALTCGFIYCLNDLNGLGMTKLDIVYLASEAERGAGLDGGKMDQYAITFGEDKHLLLLDCRSMTHQAVRFPWLDYEIVLINTMVEHDLVATEYNDRHQDCKDGLSLLQQNHPLASVRDISREILERGKTEMPAKIYDRLDYILAENERVQAVKQALQEEDINSLGALLFQSHAGLRDLYEVSCEELDFLVDWAADQPAVIGARMMGGGFGGCTINVIKTGEIETLWPKLAASYQQQYGKIPAYYRIKIGDGISRAKSLV